MKKDLISLLQSEEFLAKLNDSSTPEEVCEIFSKEGYEISNEKAKVVMDALKVANKRIRNNEEVSDEELEEIAGGIGKKDIVRIRIFEEIIVSSDISDEPDAKKPLLPIPGKPGHLKPIPGGPGDIMHKPVTLPAPPPHRPVVDCEDQKSRDEVVEWFNK